MARVCLASEELTLRVKVNGRIDGDPVWEASPAGQVRLLPGADPTEVVVWPEDTAAGLVEVTAKLDADLSSGKKELAARFQLDFGAPPATEASIEEGTAAAKRAAP